MVDVDAAALRATARAIVEAETAVVFTGAGVSTESGVPDFRGDDGVWSEYDESDFAITRFHTDPDGFWTDWLELKATLVPEGVEPNPAHRSLAALESAGHLDSVVTQNVDGLHRRAGSGRVVAIHGSADRAACRGCDASFDAAVAEERARSRGEAPRCENCGDVLKPDVVLFGERLPDVPHRAAKRLAKQCDAMLVVGSSLTVEPAASLPRIAAETGATVAVVDRHPPAGVADHVLEGDAATVVPELASAAVDLR
jgi:NAD-dependent deacetylase